MGNGVKANWHLDGLELPSEDPLQLEAVGDAIDLSGSVAQLHAELEASIETERRMDALFLDPKTMESGYVACDVKWQPEHRLMGGDKLSCFTCQHYTEDELEPRANICALGRQQETLKAQIESMEDTPSIDDEITAAYEREAAAAEELAEAMLAR